MRWIREEETFGDVLSIVRDCVAFEENMTAKNLRVSEAVNHRVPQVVLIRGEY